VQHFAPCHAPQQRNLGRLSEIAQVAFGNGFGYAIDARAATRDGADGCRGRTCARCSDAGPTFFSSCGQLSSDATRIVPPDIHRGAPQTCRGRRAPVPFADVETTIREELGQPSSGCSSSSTISRSLPASIGQVHARTLPNGRLVAVKGQSERRTPDRGRPRR